MYKIKCEALYFLYKIIIFLVYIFPSKSLFLESEKFFAIFNKRIGSVPHKPALGSSSSFYFYGLIDFRKIKKHNKLLIQEFKKCFDDINSPYLKTLPQDILNDSKLLNYFPVFVEKEIKNDLVDFLTESNIFPWYLWDIEETDYSSELNLKLYNSFLVFPVHWLIKKQDVEFIGSEIRKFLKTC